MSVCIVDNATSSFLLQVPNTKASVITTREKIASVWMKSHCTNPIIVSNLQYQWTKSLLVQYAPSIQVLFFGDCNVLLISYQSQDTASCIRFKDFDGLVTRSRGNIKSTQLISVSSWRLCWIDNSIHCIAIGGAIGVVVFRKWFDSFISSDLIENFVGSGWWECNTLNGIRMFSAINKHSIRYKTSRK